MSLNTVAAIVVNYRQPDLLRDCLRSLRAALGEAGGGVLLVVDNGSADESCEVIRSESPEALLVALDENRGFAGGVNAALSQTTAEWVLLLNNDATIAPDAIKRLVEAGRADPRVGSVAAQMRFADRPGVINSAGIGLDRLGVSFDRLVGRPVSEGGDDPIEVFGASGGAALYRRAMLDDVGGLDDSFFFGLEDVDLAWRAQARGWRCVYVPRAVAHHVHGATGRHGSAFKYRETGRNRVRMLARNASGRQLLRYGPAMVAYDLAYVAYVAVADRTLAPLRGRLRGLREWRRYRRAGTAGRRPVELAPVEGVRAALARRRQTPALRADDRP